ncbi:hypothetical protein [Mucilaginibacter sp.]|uniref:hypothetical protein n=1 Tax=Mucilaginibacter sp. TaxID=1882438 RepID=UPI00284D5725|nr:hypothetical protein [Mucilaginibacter sp.]MDR3694440.1 hypothetical protein [Mucilaginibacter sp.]
METFEVNTQNESFKVSRNNPGNSFSVFNYATFHVIKKNDFGVWREVEHRFGKENIPIDEIGDAIDRYYDMIAARSSGYSGKAKLL